MKVKITVRKLFANVKGETVRLEGEVDLPKDLADKLINQGKAESLTKK